MITNKPKMRIVTTIVNDKTIVRKKNFFINLLLAATMAARCGMSDNVRGLSTSVRLSGDADLAGRM